MLQKSADLAQQTANQTPEEFNMTMARLKALQENMPVKGAPKYNPINVALAALAMAQSPGHAAEIGAAAIQGPQTLANNQYTMAMQNRQLDIKTLDDMAHLQLQAYQDRQNTGMGTARMLGTIAGEMQRSEDAKWRGMAPLVWRLQADYMKAPSKGLADNINGLMTKMGGSAIISPDQLAGDIQAHTDAMRSVAIKDLLARGTAAG
jgi:hypothetical protein